LMDVLGKKQSNILIWVFIILVCHSCESRNLVILFLEIATGIGFANRAMTRLSILVRSLAGPTPEYQKSV